MNFITVAASAWLGLLSLFGALHVPFMHSSGDTPQGGPGEASSSMPMMQNNHGGPSSSGEAGSPSTALSSSSAQSNTNAGTNTTLAVGEVTLPATGSAWSSVLPLGDGKYATTGAEKGYVYVCHIASGGGGAQGKATWIDGSSWYPDKKVAVEGAVSWPNASYTSTVSGSTRTIVMNDLPTDHTTGIFPIQASDPAHQFDANPNSIKAQNDTFSLPAAPTFSTSPNCIYGQVGVMNDGVVLFDGFDAEYRDAVAHETQDDHEGHPDASSEYHYHGFESGFVKDAVSTVVGFAFDGFPITGSKMADGTYLKTADLDACHGLTSTITLDGKSVTSYHYVLTQDFPYSVSCFRGKSYEPKPGGGQGTSQQNTQNGTAAMGSGSSSMGGMPGTPPQAAITACANASTGASCSFTTPNGTIRGTCNTPPNQSSLACIPNH